MQQYDAMKGVLNAALMYLYFLILHVNAILLTWKTDLLNDIQRCRPTIAHLTWIFVTCDFFYHPADGSFDAWEKNDAVAD